MDKCTHMKKCNFSNDDIARYSRQLILPEMGVDGKSDHKVLRKKNISKLQMYTMKQLKQIGKTIPIDIIIIHSIQFNCGGACRYG